MASPTTWALASVVIVSLLSLVGAATLMDRRISRHGVIVFLVALAAGTLLGDAFLHLIPEAFHSYEDEAVTLGWLVIGGFVAMFILEVVLRWRHSHAEHAEDTHGHAQGHVEAFGWINLVGDAVHNLIDGIVIAAAYLVDVQVGIATTIAVAMHEIPQELGDFAVLVQAGMAPKKALLLNLGTALTAIVGALAVLLVDPLAERLEVVAVPLIAGAFLYIAAADLIPELHHHNRGREVMVILTGLLVGVALMGALLAFEPGHIH